MNSDRTILHCDLNGFFASVEALYHPEVGDKPMAVTGNPENRHGIILAKNEAAKKFGVQTAETIWQAKQKCPHLILLLASHDKYHIYSQKVNEIYSRFTNKVEPFGIDESWLDVTQSKKLFGNGVEIADKIRLLVKSELGLTVSVGVSFNKIFSKLASDYKKPDATTEFARKDIEKTVFKLNVKDMMYVGKSTAQELGKMGIFSIGDLAKADIKILLSKFGKYALNLHANANGLEDSEVAFYGTQDKAKSVGNSTTFKRDLRGISDIKAGFETLAQKVSARLKEENFKCGVLQITIKSPKFETITRQQTLQSPTNLRKDIAENALKILQENWDIDNPIRMLGISATNLIDASEPIQAELFEENSPKRTAKIEEAFLKIRNKFGDNSINFGNILDKDI